MTIQRKLVNGVELISNDGINWCMAQAAPDLSPSENLMRARCFEAPLVPVRPNSPINPLTMRKQLSDKMVVKVKNTKRLINRPRMTLRKRELQREHAALLRDASAPHCMALPPSHEEQLRPKPPIDPATIPKPIATTTYTDVYTNIDREWFHNKPVKSCFQKPVTN